MWAFFRKWWLNENVLQCAIEWLYKLSYHSHRKYIYFYFCIILYAIAFHNEFIIISILYFSINRQSHRLAFDISHIFKIRTFRTIGVWPFFLVFASKMHHHHYYIRYQIVFYYSQCIYYSLYFACSTVPNQTRCIIFIFGLQKI